MITGGLECLQLRVDQHASDVYLSDFRSDHCRQIMIQKSTISLIHREYNFGRIQRGDQHASTVYSSESRPQRAEIKTLALRRTPKYPRVRFECQSPFLHITRQKVF